MQKYPLKSSYSLLRPGIRFNAGPLTVNQKQPLVWRALFSPCSEPRNCCITHAPLQKKANTQQNSKWEMQASLPTLNLHIHCLHKTTIFLYLSRMFSVQIPTWNRQSAISRSYVSFKSSRTLLWISTLQTMASYFLSCSHNAHLVLTGECHLSWLEFLQLYSKNVY